jgi:hypothetical protein
MESDDPEILLQRIIEIEQRDNLLKANEESKKPPVKKELTPDEKMEMYLKKAKEKKLDQSDEMIVH